MTNIPDLLLNIPAPQLNSAYVEDGKVMVTVEQGGELRQAYFREVWAYLKSHPLSCERDIIPAVDFALKLFNAENFSGELVPSELERCRAIYDRFGFPVKRTKDDPIVHGDVTDAFLQRLLTCSGEMPHACLRLSGLLLCVLALVTAGSSTEDTMAEPLFPYSSVWRLRAQMRYQLALQRRAHDVFVEVSNCIDAILAQPEDVLTVADLLEVGHAQSYYHRRELAAETYRRAMKKSGLQLEESAMLGVRTRWQQHQLVQMILQAKSSRPIPVESTTEEQPKTIMSEKDGHDLLDRPREMPDAAPLETAPLHPEDKALILSLCMDIRNHNPFHGLTQQHMRTYVERVLVDPAQAPFMIRCQTLLLRARLESRRNRVQERAFMQMTELVDQHNARRDLSHEVLQRTAGDYFYAVAYPPIWSVKREYADFCFDETLYKTALDVYESILDWEKIIECCKKLDKRKRAESLARDLLEKDPLNPMLWVALGEATHEDAHLWKAWELCGHQMAAPMRALARLALDREHYDKVMEYFDEAVRINPIFGGDWFTLGFASLKLQRWDRGGEAFTRVCQIDPNDAFAWNNLASIMLRENKLRPAFNAMSQALRNNRRDWRMWQNYFQIGCQLREVTETTNALNIALDIAQRGLVLDSETMERFVENTILFLKGKIPGSSMEAEESENVKVDAVRYRSMAAQEQGTDQVDHIPHAMPVAEDEEEDAAFATLEAFGADVEMPEAFFTRQAVDEGRRAELQAGILRRHGQRVREVFLRLMGLFVTDPDLYATAAQLFAFLDGPMESFRLRQKELRACQQKDQWERQDALFDRTVECLHHMSEDAFAALEEARSEDPAGASAQNEEAEPLPTPAAETDLPPAQPAVRLEGRQLQAAVIHAFKEIQNHIKAVLEATEEHMEERPSYKSLRALASQVRSGLQEAKASFD